MKRVRGRTIKGQGLQQISGLKFLNVTYFEVKLNFSRKINGRCRVFSCPSGISDWHSFNVKIVSNELWILKRHEITYPKKRKNGLDEQGWRRAQWRDYSTSCLAISSAQWWFAFALSTAVPALKDRKSLMLPSLRCVTGFQTGGSDRHNNWDISSRVICWKRQ